VIAPGPPGWSRRHSDRCSARPAEQRRLQHDGSSACVPSDALRLAIGKAPSRPYPVPLPHLGLRHTDGFSLVGLVGPERKEFTEWAGVEISDKDADLIESIREQVPLMASSRVARGDRTPGLPRNGA